MKNCSFCSELGRVRKYLKSVPLCGDHYAEFLEFWIEDSGDEITVADATSAFEKYKIKLVPKSDPIIPLSEPEPTLEPFNTSFKIGR